MQNLNVSGSINFTILDDNAKAVLLDFFYPIGSYYFTDSDSLNTKAKVESHFGGTWQQVTYDAYLKIVTSNGGITGGTNSEHKIPISSMPSHNHGFDLFPQEAGIRHKDLNVPPRGGDRESGNWGWCTTTSTGGGGTYYPYYVGLYCFKRIG